MNTFLFCWNPNKWNWETLPQDARASASGEVKQDRWSCINSQVRPGDRAFLMMLGREDRGVIASGWTTSTVYLDAHWDTAKAKRGEKCQRADCQWEKIIDPSVESPLLVTVLCKHLADSEFDWTPQASGIRVPDRVAEQLERLWAAHLGKTILAAVDVDEDLRAIEGEQRIAVVRHRRRERKLRMAKLKEALRLGKGRLCCEVPSCGFDFHEVYGEVGFQFAHVHHLKPFSDRTAPSETRVSDLAVICANCHAMVHRGGECRPLAGLIRTRKTSRSRRV